MQKKEKIQNKNRGLTITLALAFLLFSIIVLVSSSIINIYFSFLIQKKVIDRDQEIILHSAAESVRQFIYEKLNLLETGIRLSDLSSANDEEKEILLERLMGFDRAFRQIMILDELGAESIKVTQSLSYATGHILENCTQDMLDVLSKDDYYISTVYIDEMTNEPLILIGVNIKDVFEHRKGILIAEINLKFMWDLVGNLHIGKEGVVYVVDKDGVLIAFEDPGLVLKRINLIHLDEVKEFALGNLTDRNSFFEISKGIFGTFVVTSHEHIEDSDWAVIVELPVFEAYANIITQIKFSIVFLSLSLFLTVIIGIVFSKKISKPIIMLRDAAIEIGKGNLDRQIRLDTDNELGELSESLDMMRKSIKEQRKKLEDYSNTLECKVRHRTKELELKNKDLEKFKMLTVDTELYAEKMRVEKTKGLKTINKLQKELKKTN